ncbi:MAG TPA: aspartyl protease family protein [Cyclobacteriaceae bacterium]|nr:aspartyl protease family protein [Cyclobacteriaceae bacterium]
MRKFLLSLILALSSTFCLAQYYGFKIESDRNKVIIPVEILNNMVVVPVVLNNQIPLKFILDTGVRTTVLTQKTYSDILGLDYSKEIVVSGPGNEKLVHAFVTDNVTFDLPGVHGKGHSMLVLEKDYLELRNYLGAEVHGILGYELFSRFIVQMDYERKRIILYLPNRFRKRGRYQTLPISVEDTKPFVTVTTRMNPETSLNAKLLMDTGASHGLILDPESEKRISVPEKNLNSIIGRGLGGEITGKIGRIDALEMGKYKIENIIANFPDPNSYMDTLLTKSNIYRNGAIGGEILSRFSVIFNFPKEEVYLKKNSSYRKHFNYDMSGITVKAIGARLRTYEITNLRHDSPADLAGLKEGDQIIAINGSMVFNMDLNHVNGFFNSKEGKRVSVEVEREGKRMKFEFRLVNQI